MTDKEMHEYEQIVEREIATAEELNMVKAICGGFWQEVLNKVVYYRTGYNTFEDYLWDESEESCDDFEDYDLEMGFDNYSGCYDFDC